jgi:hypothetical protein
MSLDTYNAPTGAYTARIPPGTAAFRKVVGEHFGFLRTEVVRDRSRCAHTRSEHCECAAIDFFTSVYAKGRPFFDWCVSVAEPLGIQSVIFWRRVIGFGNPNERDYHGASPHTDHVHVGLNRWARANLTEDMVRRLLPGEENDLTPEQAKMLTDVHQAIYGTDGKPGDYGTGQTLYGLLLERVDGAYVDAIKQVRREIAELRAAVATLQTPGGDGG